VDTAAVAGAETAVAVGAVEEDAVAAAVRVAAAVGALPVLVLALVAEAASPAPLLAAQPLSCCQESRCATWLLHLAQPLCPSVASRLKK
jgi:hypothetical protein